MSKEIDTALKNFVRKFHELCQKDPKTGEYNFYIEKFRREGKSIDNAIDDLTEDHTGYFEEFVFDEMRDESLALLRAICQAEVYVTWQAYYDPSKVFKTREEYLIHAQKWAKEAQAKLTEHYHKLATYYNDKQRFFNEPEVKISITDY
jgi:hypothetical protein